MSGEEEGAIRARMIERWPRKPPGTGPEMVKLTEKQAALIAHVVAREERLVRAFNAVSDARASLDGTDVDPDRLRGELDRALGTLDWLIRGEPVDDREPVGD